MKALTETIDNLNQRNFHLASAAAMSDPKTSENGLLTESLGEYLKEIEILRLVVIKHAYNGIFS